MSDVDLTDLKSRPSDGSHIPDGYVPAIEAWVRRALRLLDLNYWRVYVAKDMPPERCRLMIEPTDGRRRAMLYVSEGWCEEVSADEKRVDLTHEVLHLIHHDQEEVIRRFKNDQGDVGSYAMHLIWSQFKTETERMVDSLSYVVAPFMPKWADPKGQPGAAGGGRVSEDGRRDSWDAAPSLWCALFGRRHPHLEIRYCRGKGPLTDTGARIKYQAFDKHGTCIAEEWE